MNGARFIRNDLSLVVEELLEEQEEHHKRTTQGAATSRSLQVANIDFSYGPVQVLFDVDFEVQQGRDLALLGTNGAGKSTILRVISGLAVPERGVVRLNGQQHHLRRRPSSGPAARDHAAARRQGRVPAA